LTELIGREIHDLALELRPTALDDLGLEAALQNYAEEWSERAGVEVDFHLVSQVQTRLPTPVETALYRVALEALANVHRHAHATRVSLVLQKSDEHVSVVIEDNGMGFDPDAPPPAGTVTRLGILGMRERLALVGGTLTVESSPGKGTTIIARVPLAEEGAGSHV
jgi:signal transduction histidine kinase